MKKHIHKIIAKRNMFIKLINKYHRRLFFFTTMIVCGALLAVILIRFNQSRPEVTLTESGFEPSVITVKRGTTVKFRTTLKKSFWPASNLHPEHSIYSEFDPKKAIEPDSEWSFTFTNEGTWRYHDHLFPNFTGKVIVLDDEGKEKGIVTDCMNVPKKNKSQCWDDLLNTVTENEGLEEGFKVFVNLHNSDTDIPKNCHGWSHILGREAYKIYKKEGDITLRPEVSFCGYGFFHGFMEQLLLDTGDYKGIKQFCDNAAKNLNNNQVYQNCVHGVGHGSVDLDNIPENYIFDDILYPSLKTCDLAFNDPTDEQGCYGGVFNALVKYDVRKYDPRSTTVAQKIDLKILFNRCRDLDELYKPRCYYEATGPLVVFGDYSFQKASNVILAEKISTESLKQVTFKMAADLMERGIVGTDWEENVSNCRTLPSNVIDKCLEGTFYGFWAHGYPGKEYEKAVKFCRADYLTQEEKKSCYVYVVRMAEGKIPKICSMFESEYQIYCRNNKT